MYTAFVYECCAHVWLAPCMQRANTRSTQRCASTTLCLITYVVFVSLAASLVIVYVLRCSNLSLRLLIASACQHRNALCSHDALLLARRVRNLTARAHGRWDVHFKHMTNPFALHPAINKRPLAELNSPFEAGTRSKAEPDQS